jgi:hypothetical protein
MDHRNKFGLVSRSPDQVRLMDRRLAHGTLFGTNRLPTSSPASYLVPMERERYGSIDVPST